MPIKIALVSDVSSVLKGMKDVGSGFADVADSLDDLAREAQRDGKKVGDGLADGVEDGTRDATRSVEKLEKSFEELARSTNRASTDVGDDLSRSVHKGTSEAGDTVREFKDEARSNFSEVASSFTGSIDSAADLVQGTLGGLAGSLPGPVGLITGLLAGIGGAWFASMQENSEKNKQLIEDLTADMIESGQKVASEAFISSALNAIFTGAEDAAIKVEELNDKVALTGITSGILARAYVGDADAIKVATAQIGDEIKDAWEKAHTGPIEERQYWANVALELEGVQDDLTGVASSTDTAAARQEAYNDAVRAGGDAAEGSAARAGTAYDNLGRKIDDMPAVKLEVDTKDADETLARWRDRHRSLIVGVMARPLGTQQPV